VRRVWEPLDATDTASLFTFSDKPETLTIPTSQEITETSQLTAVQSQTSQSHTGSQPGIISAGRSATSADITRTDMLLPSVFSYYDNVPIIASHVPARAAIRDTTVLPLSALARVAPVEEGDGTGGSSSLGHRTAGP